MWWTACFEKFETTENDDFSKLAWVMKLTNFRLTDTTTELYELKTELPTESYNFMIKKWNWPKVRFLEPKTGKDVIMSERKREVGASRLLSRFFNVNVVFGVFGVIVVIDTWGG